MEHVDKQRAPRSKAGLRQPLRDLPDDAIVPLEAAAMVTSLAPSTIQIIRRSDPTFPAIRKLSAYRKGYRLGDLLAWTRSRPAA